MSAPKSFAWKSLALGLALLGLAGCDLMKSRQTGQLSSSLAEPDVAVTEPSPASLELRAYYAKVQSGLLAQDLLRTDGGRRDAPFNARLLAQNFIRIAAFDEYRSGVAGPIQQETESRIRRWNGPVRVGLRFGASVPPAQRATDTAQVSAYVARLAAATRHPIRMDDANPNFLVYIVDEDERRALAPVVSAALPGITPPELRDFVNLPRSSYCVVYAQSDLASSTYGRAFAMIRAEHPALLRQLCLHEEIAQGLGLANDSPQARPSIFNDNEEFALLTPQDELMLRILYDPRLSPGMTADQARPIVEAIASELLGGES